MNKTEIIIIITFTKMISRVGRQAINNKITSDEVLQSTMKEIKQGNHIMRDGK